MLKYKSEVAVALNHLPYLSTFPFEYHSPQWNEFQQEGPDGYEFYVTRAGLLAFLDAFEKKYGLDSDTEPYHSFVEDAMFLFTEHLFKVQVDYSELIVDL